MVAAAGPLPAPSSSIQSQNVAFSSGTKRSTSRAMPSRARSSSASHAWRYVSRPKRSHSDRTRSAAVREAAISAIRSEWFISGVRVLFRISFSAGSFSTPFSTIRTGGIRMPSSQIESASAACEPEFSASSTPEEYRGSRNPYASPIRAQPSPAACLAR